MHQGKFNACVPLLEPWASACGKSVCRREISLVPRSAIALICPHFRTALASNFPSSNGLTMGLRTPVLFCIFNRPALTARVFEAIRQAKPPTLLVVQDGKRAHAPQDEELIGQSRSILSKIDWPCELRTNFADFNLGCAQRMASGISWGFEHFEQLIILEDDCLPHPQFFDFCETLLDRYADERRVMTISGDNFQSAPRSRYGYYFSKFAHIWGWASWRRAWQEFDLSISNWPEYRRANRIAEICSREDEQSYWIEIFDRQHAGQIDTWDYPWMFAHWRRGGLTILPNSNLVTNLGFGPGATHTIDSMSPLAELPLRPLDAMLHPPSIEQDEVADEWTWDNIFKPPSVVPAPIREARTRRWWWLRRSKPSTSASSEACTR